MATLSYRICLALGIEDIENSSTLTAGSWLTRFCISNLILADDKDFFSFKATAICFLQLAVAWVFASKNGEVQGLYARGLQSWGLATSEARNMEL